MAILKEKDEISMALKSVMMLLVILAAGVVVLDSGTSDSDVDGLSIADFPITMKSETVDGVNYLISSNIAIVMGYESGTEELFINETFTLSGTEYQVKAIANEAFKECNTLERVTIGNIDRIGESAFSGCHNLVYVKIGDVETIDNDVFGSVPFYNKEGNIVSQTAENLSNRVFIGNNSNMYEICVGMSTISDALVYKITNTDTFEASLSGFNYNSDGIYVPQTVSIFDFDFRVTSVSDGAFRESRVQAVDLGDIQTVGKKAFYGCPNLAVLKMDKVTQIGNRAFTKCSSLTEVSIGCCVEDCAFYGCSSLKTLTISDDAEIGSRAFAACSGLEKVVFGNPASITEDAFNGVRFYGTDGSSMSCSAENLSEKTFIGSDGKLREYAAGTPFTYDGLRYAITSIDPATAALTGYVDSVGYVTVPDTVELGPESFEVTSIGDRAFLGCTEITGIYASSVESVGEKAFYGCTNFGSFNCDAAGVILDGIDVGNRAFAYCKEISAVHANSAIGDFAFYGCSTIDNITFEDGASIGTKAFYGCDNF